MEEVDVSLIRKLAALENGRRFIAERDQVDFNPVVVARMQKAAQADQELLKIAAWSSTGDSLEMYELLGGTFEDPPVR